MMADGWARVSGRVGVCSVHQGPGLTNAVTGLAEAAKSRTPLLVLSGDTPAAARTSNFRIDQDALVQSVGAIAERLHAPETAQADAARALRRAELERRPFVLSMPIDLEAQPAAQMSTAARPAACADGAVAARVGRRRGRGAAGEGAPAAAARRPRRGAVGRRAGARAAR